MKVKVGPITAQYKGSATFVERDEANRRAVVSASGRDTRGQGNASATITATLTPDGDGTQVAVATDLTVTGKVAQFGRGVMADVSAKLLDQFVESLEATVLRGETEADVAAVAAPTDTPERRRIDSDPAVPVDLLDAAGSPLLRRLAPVLGALFGVVLLARGLRRRRRR